MSRPALGPTHPCAMGTGGPFSGGKARPGREADHSPCSAEVKNEKNYSGGTALFFVDLYVESNVSEKRTDSIFRNEYERSTTIRNVRTYLQVHLALQPTIPKFGITLHIYLECGEDMTTFSAAYYGSFYASCCEELDTALRSYTTVAICSSKISL
jgi:hypothetical protein